MPPKKKDPDDRHLQKWMHRICGVPLSTWKHVSIQYTMSDRTCWIWTGSKDVNGYAKMRYNKKLIHVRTFLYQRIQWDIPVGRRIKNTCRNKECINPNHMKCLEINFPRRPET